jgi:hypothetical protein
MVNVIMPIVVLLIVVMLNVVLLIVVMLSVVAPWVIPNGTEGNVLILILFLKVLP